MSARSRHATVLRENYDIIGVSLGNRVGLGGVSARKSLYIPSSPALIRSLLNGMPS